MTAPKSRTSTIAKHPSIIFNVITLLIVVGGWVWILGARAGEIDHLKVKVTGIEEKMASAEKVENLADQVDKLEQAAKSDHDTLIEMRADVKWIRSRLEALKD